MENDHTDALTRRQRGALLLVSMISPLFRQAPGSAVGYAGGGVWLSALAAGVLYMGLELFLLRLVPAGMTLGEALCASVGRLPGRLAQGLYTIYICIYAGFVLRSGADRFVAAVYPDSPVWVPGAVLLLPVIPAALGRRRVLGRVAELTAPFLTALLALVFLFALPEVHWEELSLQDSSVRGILGGSLPLLDALSVSAFLLFSERRSDPGEDRGCFLLPAGILGGMGVLLCLTTVGAFGPALTERMNYPFFVMTRSVNILQVLERAEAFIVAQWVITDYVLLTALCHAAGETAAALLPWSDRRRRILGCMVLLLGSALLCAGDAFALRELSRFWVPLVNAGAVGLLPVLLLPGYFRRKRQ